MAMAINKPADAPVEVPNVEVTPVNPIAPKVVQLKELEDEMKGDPLLARLKAIDLNGDGVFSADELMQAARDVVVAEEARRSAQESAKRLGWAIIGLGIMLLLSLGGSFACSLLALQMVKEAQVAGQTGTMLTNPGASQPPAPVGTSPIKEVRQGVSGLKECTKEELERLKEITFFHDGAYHRMQVCQVHRFDGRVEVWGCSSGVLVVEDTGEVHYVRFGVPSPALDACWAANASSTIANYSDVCGESVDNTPPMRLEVESPALQDPANAPAAPPAGSAGNGSETNGTGGRRLVAIGTDHAGQEIWREVVEEETEASHEARRLSSRRRSSSRRRGGARRRAIIVSSPRRRSFGSTISRAPVLVSGDSRRRAPVFDPVKLPTMGTPSVVVSGMDGSSRRREVDFYGSSESRRRSIGLEVNETDLDDDNFTFPEGAIIMLNENAPQATPIQCDADQFEMCKDQRCWCEKKSVVVGWVIGLSVSVFLVAILGSACICFRVCCKRN